MTLPPTRFSTPEQRLRAQVVLRAHEADPARSAEALDVLTEAAWHLRQEQAAAAAAACRQVLRMQRSLASADAAERPPARTAWALLTRAEWHWLNGHRRRAEACLLCLEALPDAALPDAAHSDLLWLRASLASDRGQFADRRRFMEAARDRADRAADPDRRLSCELALDCFDTFESGGHPPDAALQRARQVLLHPDAGTQALAHCLLSHCSMGRGDYVQAIVHTQSSAAAAQGGGQWRRALIDTCNLGSLLTDLGDMEASLAVLEPALAQARALGWPALVGTCLLNLAQTLIRLQRPQQAGVYAEEAVALLQVSSGSKQHLNAVYTQAEAAAACGNRALSRSLFRSLSTQPQHTETIELERYAELGLARLDADEGLLDQALQRTHRVLAPDSAAPDRVLEVQALQLLGGLHLQQIQATDDAAGDGQALAATVAAARSGMQALAQALQRAAQHGVPLQAAQLLHDLAGTLEQAGQAQEALAAHRLAFEALVNERGRSAQQQAQALELRLRTAQVQAELQAQRSAAEAEARRGAELQALNQELTQALQGLQQAQAALEQRNQALQSAHERIQELSLTDPLTGLRNRRHLLQAIPAVLTARRSSRQAERRERPGLVFFLLDLDGFKRVNDQHGHAAGDAVLVQLAERLRAVTRAHDDLVRWGGEEFLIVMQGLEPEEAPAMAERLRLAVADHPFALPKHTASLPLGLTTSVGWALHPEGEADSTAGCWEDAIARADTRMYRAKLAGGNRCQGPDRG